MSELKERIKNKLQKVLRCPVCSLLDDLEYDILCKLQYDVTNDEAIRNSIASEGGFCDFHFRQFRKVANSKTNALLLSAVIDHYMKANMEYSLHCRLCNASAEYEHNLLSSFLTLIEDSVFQEEYAKHSGLCIGHLMSLFTMDISESAKKWLMDVLRISLQNDLPLLQDMAGVSYYNTKRIARSSIIRCTEKFAGRRALGL